MMELTEPYPLALDVQSEIDVVYEMAGDHELKLDLYWHPTVKEAEPLIGWIHGGAWRGGDKAEPLAALRMLRLGYAVASINYRLSSEATFPAQIYACKAALRWLRSRSSAYRLAPPVTQPAYSS